MIELPSEAPLKAYQHYIHDLETQQGWLDVDLVHNCFLMGEEVGELFKSVRRYNRYFEEGQSEADNSERKAQVAEEIVDVFNYLLAIANRLEIDVESAFRDKNTKNQSRSWA